MASTEKYMFIIKKANCDYEKAIISLQKLFTLIKSTNMKALFPELLHLALDT